MTHARAIAAPEGPAVVLQPAGPSANPVDSAVPRRERETPVVLAAPHAPPRIIAVALSASRVHSGDIVFGHVRTTSNVASVEVRVEGFSTVMLRRSIGDFILNYAVPMLPPWLHRTYPVQVIARNVDGVRETRTLEVTVE